jgi:integrase
MERDSTAGLELPADQNVSRPVATSARYRKLREHSDEVTMEILAGGKKVQVRTYLSELLDLAFHTGRRIGAILGLQYADLHPNARPHGAITWRADTDKMGKAWTAPLNEAARAAIDRVLVERPGIGAAYLFRSPRKPDQPVSKDLASAWLEKCEKLADVPHLKQGLWHPFRRSWATARKHLPVQDVAACGGWSDSTVLSALYMAADADTMLRVATEAAEVREVQHG